MPLCPHQIKTTKKKHRHQNTMLLPLLVLSLRSFLLYSWRSPTSSSSKSGSSSSLSSSTSSSPSGSETGDGRMFRKPYRLFINFPSFLSNSSWSPTVKGMQDLFKCPTRAVDECRRVKEGRVGWRALDLDLEGGRGFDRQLDWTAPILTTPFK